MKAALLVFQKIEKRMCSYRRLAYERSPFIIPMVIIIVGIMSARIMSMVITNPIKNDRKHLAYSIKLLTYQDSYCIEKVIKFDYLLNTKVKVGSTLQLIKDYVEGKVYPANLKSSVSDALINLLEPARKYFLEGPGKNLLEEMKEIKVTR